MQTRRGSMIEAVTNTVVSFIVAWFLYWAVLPWMFGIRMSASGSAAMVLLFNVVSLIRQFVLRRLFNSLETRP